MRPELIELAYDPQTAGGLLVSLPRDRGPALEAEFARAGLFLARVGTVEHGSGRPACPRTRLQQCVPWTRTAQPLSARASTGAISPGVPALWPGPASRCSSSSSPQGATGRLTGSGLGCEHWPGCEQHHFEPRSFHSYIEFGNRARRVPDDPRHARRVRRRDPRPGCRAGCAGSPSRSSQAPSPRRRSGRSRSTSHLNPGSSSPTSCSRSSC